MVFNLGDCAVNIDGCTFDTVPGRFDGWHSDVVGLQVTFLYLADSAASGNRIVCVERGGLLYPVT